MLEFNLEDAKKGAKICTRSGNKARIICFDRVNNHKDANLIALVLGKSAKHEMCLSYDKFGHTQGSHDPSLDLMIDDGK